AQDLCSRLLLQDPKARLGAGTNADGNGYDALKVLSHPFFTGINWATLGRSTSPYVPHISPLPPTDSVRVSILNEPVCDMVRTYMVGRSDGRLAVRRGEIPWSDSLYITVKNSHQFDVVTILVIRNCSTSQVVRRRCNLSSRWIFERNLSESSSYVTMQAFQCQQPQWTELSSPQPDASFAAKNTPTPTSTTTFFATRPHIVIPKECMNMMSKTSPLSVHALHAGTALECELSNMGYDVAAEYLFWKEENLALLEMSFPAMDRDILEEVLVETEFDLGAAVDVIRSRVDVINDMGVEVSLDDMLQHYGEHRRSAHEWVLIQDDWEVIDDMLRAADNGRVDDAITHYQHSIQAYELFGPAYNNLGILVHRRGHANDEAKRLHEHAAVVSLQQGDWETYASAHNNLGYLVRLGQEKSYEMTLRAIHHFDLALQVSPPNCSVGVYVSALYNKGSALYGLGNFDQAQLLLGHVLALEPSHGGAHLDMGNIYFHQGRLDKALHHQHLLVQLGSTIRDVIGALNNQGQFLKEIGHVHDALASHTQALYLGPTDGNTLLNVITARRQLCLWEDADDWHDRLLELTSASLQVRPTPL
ncbi:hypothetical protein DYB26_009923, partial [Aphanomyces astaci]